MSTEPSIVIADGYIAAGLAVAALAGHEVSRRRNKRKRNSSPHAPREDSGVGEDLEPPTLPRPGFALNDCFHHAECDGYFESEDIHDETHGRDFDMGWVEPAFSTDDLFSDDDDWRTGVWEPTYKEEEWEPMRNETTTALLLPRHRRGGEGWGEGVARCADGESFASTSQMVPNPVSLTRFPTNHGERTSNLYGRIWLVAMLLLAGWFGFHSLRPNSSQPLVPIAINAADANDSVATKNIEEIQVGDRVYAENPTDDRDDGGYISNINRITWRKLTLEATKQDGGIAEVTLLRPEEWINDRGAQVGGQIRLRLVEVGVDGPARVLSIEPCPEINPGVGQIVTGTFKHLAANVVNLHIDSLDEPIGVTGNHPIWSHDRQEFVFAANLQPGEHLRTLNGLTRVAGITKQAVPETVYNFEVHLHHVYHVTEAGVLVHNDYELSDAAKKDLAESVKYKKNAEALLEKKKAERAAFHKRIFEDNLIEEHTFEDIQENMRRVTRDANRLNQMDDFILKLEDQIALRAAEIERLLGGEPW